MSLVFLLERSSLDFVLGDFVLGYGDCIKDVYLVFVGLDFFCHFFLCFNYRGGI